MSRFEDIAHLNDVAFVVGQGTGRHIAEEMVGSGVECKRVNLLRLVADEVDKIATPGSEVENYRVHPSFTLGAVSAAIEVIHGDAL